jgi:hypothetical protein
MPSYGGKSIKEKRDELNITSRKMYWLLGRNSGVLIHNKIILYKQVICPVWSYGIQLWNCARHSLKPPRDPPKGFRAGASPPLVERGRSKAVSELPTPRPDQCIPGVLLMLTRRARQAQGGRASPPPPGPTRSLRWKLYTPAGGCGLYLPAGGGEYLKSKGVQDSTLRPRCQCTHRP